MKRIKIEKVRCFEDWAFKIVEQTHRECEFGKDGQTYFQGSKLRLTSLSYPELSYFYRKDVYVQGADRFKDWQILLVTDEEMQDIELTIKEYNDFFTDDFKVGDKVWDVVKGEGIVTNVSSEGMIGQYPIRVDFTPIKSVWYTSEGKLYEIDTLPALYKYPVKIVRKEGT